MVSEVTIHHRGSAHPATLLEPGHPNGAAILYCHAHGGRYDIGRRELLEGRPAIGNPVGPEIARHGYTVLCADMPVFGSRQHEGTEAAHAKALLWNGQTMMGEALDILRACVHCLATRPEIDPQRIAAFGVSMGATHAYWLAALDTRIAAVAHVCAFSNIRPLITTGAHDRHGFYMTVPGLLDHGDMGDVAALIAPRPQLVGSGAEDALTPAEALQPALATLTHAYSKSDRLRIFTEPASGHVFTPRLRAETLRFFDETVGSRNGLSSLLH